MRTIIYFVQSGLLFKPLKFTFDYRIENSVNAYSCEENWLIQNISKQYELCIFLRKDNNVRKKKFYIWIGSFNTKKYILQYFCSKSKKLYVNKSTSVSVTDFTFNSNSAICYINSTFQSSHKTIHILGKIDSKWAFSSTLCRILRSYLF